MYLSFPAGTLAVMVAMLSAAIGLGFCALLTVAALLTTLRGDETRGQRVRRWVAGPAGGVVTATITGFVLNNAAGDELCWLTPTLALITWLVIAMRLRAPASQAAIAMTTGSALRWGLLTASVLLLGLGMFLNSPLPFPAGCAGLGLAAVWAFVARPRPT